MTDSPQDTAPIRWGILSTGNIASKFAEGLAVLDDAQLVAVGSRSQGSADAFGDTYHVPNRHASYEALANDPDVDAIYIGTPHPFHKENALLCIEAGKAVLLEKPFTLNAADTQIVIDAARAKGVFLMEAMWMRFTPGMRRILDLIAGGAIGEVRMVQASFCFRKEFDPQQRLFNPDLGGGSLLDVGIYPATLASLVLGHPQTIQSAAHMGSTGVDEQAAMLFTYANGALATLTSGVRTHSRQEAQIAGTEGVIRIAYPWWTPERFTLTRGTETAHYELPFDANGYEYEAAEVNACLRAGKLESNLRPLDETLAVMQTLDTIREQWGLRYPGE